jgi:hypothetical protein
VWFWDEGIETSIPKALKELMLLCFSIYSRTGMEVSFLFNVNLKANGKL